MMEMSLKDAYYTEGGMIAMVGSVRYADTDF